MKNIFRIAIVLLCLSSLLACTSMQPVEDLKPETIRTNLHQGDKVTVWLKSGEIHAFTIYKTDDKAIYGSDGQSTENIPYSQITRLEVNRTDAVKTVGGIGAGVLAVLGVVALIGVLVIKHALDHAGD